MKRRIPLTLVICLIVFASPPFPPAGAASNQSASLDLVEATISAELARWKAPSLSAALVSDHRVVWSHGFGLADIEQRVAAKTATVYRIASISKPITAVAVLQLVEAGRLDLEEPIQRYCPTFPTKPWPITTEQLLAHLGGVRGYKSNDELYSTRHYTDVREPLALFKDDPLLHEPGTKFSYTTYGYNVLGCVIEGASGMSYVDYVRERIFRPADMLHTRPDDVYAVIPNRARSYRKAPNGELQNAPLADSSNKIPGGGFCATAEDLARFALAVQTGHLLGKEMVAQMFTRQTIRDGREIPFGLGWAVGTRHGRKEVWHMGGGQGVSNILYMRPQEGTAVALLVNVNGLATPPEEAPILGLARRIIDIVSPPMLGEAKGAKR